MTVTVAADFDGLIVDLDGVVWIGPDPVPGSAAAINELRARGIALVFLTNDPTGSRAEYAARLEALGISATVAEIITSGRALASLVLEREGKNASVFIIGSPALKAEFEAAGLKLDPGGRDAVAVAVGGHADFDYDELRAAAHAVRRGASLYAAGRDATFPMPDGPWPATGSILAAVETAAGVRATVAGKPERPIFETARSLLEGCARVAVVGDHLEADIAGGRCAGLVTILVLTGAASRKDLETEDVAPDLVVPDLGRLVEVLGPAPSRAG